jgi:hypothetical protein
MRAHPLGIELWAAPAAAVLALTVDGLYLVVVRGQGDPVGSRVSFVALELALAALAAVLPAPPLARIGLLAWSTATFAAWMFLGAASIGITLAPSTALAAIALHRVMQPGAAAAAMTATGIGAAILAVAVGVAWTS